MKINKVFLHTDALSSWKLDKADWSAFSEACSHELTIENIHTGYDAIKTFTENLISIASRTIPKSKAGKQQLQRCNSIQKESSEKSQTLSYRPKYRQL